MTPRIAFVAGSTGLVGSYLVRLLAEDAFFDSVVALARRPLEFIHPKVETREVELDNLPDLELAGATHVFCCLGTTMRQAGNEAAFRAVDYDYPLSLARKAATAGAARFLLVSSVGANARSGSFDLRVKGELEDQLHSLPFEALHIFRPSVLMGMRKEKRPGERAGLVLARTFEWALVAGLRKYRPIAAPVLARAMAVTAERGPTGTHVFHFDDITRWGS
jgi:uncharacterized protein YbjT (DUF2867 family)